MSAMTDSHTTNPPGRRMLGAFAAAVIALGALAMGPASPALAHDELTDQRVLTNADGTADAVRLSFNNSIIEVGTEFVITNEAGDSVTSGAPVIDGPDVVQKVEQGLAEGDYAGAWRVVSSDGHPIEGTFSIVVASDGAATLGSATESAEHEHEHGETTEAGGETAEHANHVTAEKPATPTSLYVFIGIGGVLVVAVVIGAFVARSRRIAKLGESSDNAKDAR